MDAFGILEIALCEPNTKNPSQWSGFFVSASRFQILGSWFLVLNT